MPQSRLAYNIWCSRQLLCTLRLRRRLSLNYPAALEGCQGSKVAKIAPILILMSFPEDPRRFSFPGFSYNSLVGKFMVFITDAELSRHVFSYNDPDTLLMAVHPSGKNILGSNNLAFMHGPPHKAIR